MKVIVEDILSPNFDERAAGKNIKYVVLHYTGMPEEKWLEEVQKPETKLSAHYMIRENGIVVKLVEENKRAWHAGKSFWQGETDLNSVSIGIEIANLGHYGNSPPFPDNQIRTLTELLQQITEKYGMDKRKAILAHSDIAPMRKKDPGEKFPWKILAQEGLGVWVEEYNGTEKKSGEAISILRSIGYNCPNEDISSPEIRAVIIAFQRRYLPHRISGELDGTTIAMIKEISRILGK